jgi:ribosomal protein L32
MKPAISLLVTKKTCSWSDLLTNDPLQAYAGLAACPNCGCLERMGTVRCAECGTFHSGIHMEERVKTNAAPPVERAPIDPTAYSLSGAQELPPESFEETEELTSWEGGSSDFTMEEGHEKPLSRINPDELEFLPPEDLSNIE